MPEGLKIDHGAEQTIRELLRALLESGKVSAVLSLGRTGGPHGGVAYSLFTDPEAFGPEGAALPLHPFMPANAGGLLSRMTLKGGLTRPIAAVVKPCELRAFVEVIKLNQANIDNLVIISSTCGGVYPFDAATNGGLGKRLPQYWEKVKQGELAEDLRTACRSCVHFVPGPADITFALFGESDLDAQCTLYLHTEKAAALVAGLDGFQGTPVSGELGTASVQRSLGQREAFRDEVFAQVKVGLEGLVHTFGRCISCHACKTVCPICYCQLCHFDSSACERSPSFYEGELRKKGGLRVPADTVYFQLGRMTHMSASCVGCGMCADVCPADIPVSTIFSKVGASVQAAFEYVPGRDLDEQIPVKTYEQEELAQVAT
jgi:formate dehydrogenase subunit beta